MRICFLSLISIVYTYLVPTKVHGHSLRAVPAADVARRHLQVKDWPYATFISYIGKADGKDWCITAKNGILDGDPLGFDLCGDLDNPRNDQLFLLDDTGKIHSFEDPSMCFFVEDGVSPINDGHSHLRFGLCNRQADYNTFTHNRDTGELRVENAPSFCIKQHGPRPQATDALLAFSCNSVQDVGTMFEYREFGCVPSLFPDVDCCDSSECPVGSTCRDYACTDCDIMSPDVQCCTDVDCVLEGEICDGDRQCVIDVPLPTDPPPNPGTGCNKLKFGIECCSDTDCPTGYNCLSNTCVEPAIFLVSKYDANTAWCASANVGLGRFDEVGFEPCNFSNAPPNQLWHKDRAGHFRSNADLTSCMTVGPGLDIFGGLKIYMAPCMLNTFNYDAATGQIQLGEDESQCLTSINENVLNEGRLSGKPCETSGSFQFEEKLV